MEVDQTRVRIQRAHIEHSSVKITLLKSRSMFSCVQASSHVFRSTEVYCVAPFQVISMEMGSDSFVRYNNNTFIHILIRYLNLFASILLILDAVLKQDSAKTDSLLFFHLFYPICFCLSSHVPVNHRHFLSYYIAVSISVRMISTFSCISAADCDIFGSFGCKRTAS